MPWSPPENPTPVTAKMYVRGVELQNGQTQLTMGVVTRGDDNKEWAAYTPWGEMKLGIRNELAAEQFWPGQEWIITMTPVPPEQVGQEGMGA